MLTLKFNLNLLREDKVSKILSQNIKECLKYLKMSKISKNV